MKPSEQLLGHKHYNLVLKKFGAEAIENAIAGGLSLDRFLDYAESLNPGTRRMIVNGEWVDVQTDHLGTGEPQEEWENFRDLPERNAS